MKKIKNIQHSNLIKELKSIHEILTYLNNELYVYRYTIKNHTYLNTTDKIEIGKSINIVKRIIKKYQLEAFRTKKSIKTCQSSYNKFHGHDK